MTHRGSALIGAGAALLAMLTVATGVVWVALWLLTALAESVK